MTHASRLKPGFSLIEIMVAVAIMLVFAAMVGPAIFRYFAQSKVRSTEANIQTLRQSVNGYYSYVGQFPQNLEDLVEKPDNMSERKWGGPYIEGGKLPKDGWGDDFQYELTDAKRGQFKIYSVNLEDESEE